MTRRSLFTQILWPFLTVIIVGLSVTMWEATVSMREFHRDETRTSLECRARLFVREIENRGLLKEATAAAGGILDAVCKELGNLYEARITFVLPSGKVAGDSDENPAEMDNHGDRPEIREALAGHVGRSIRHSHTKHSDLVYVAIPVYHGAVLCGVVRMSASLEAVDQVLSAVHARLFAAGGIIALLSVAVSFWLARRVTGPVKDMVAGARAYAEGDLGNRLPVPRSTELGKLATAMNLMAGHLDERIKTVRRQRNELDAVFSSMAEGAVAVDREERVVSLNRAAAALFGVDLETARGRDIREVVRNPKIQECVLRKLADSEPFVEDVLLTNPEERHIRVSATGLRDERGAEIGALLVLEDITELWRLERVRRDFVANLSHEIRTPVTSIKGYAETLLGEASRDPETLEQFLNVIVRQADRLSALVDDILSLATLERSEAAKDIPFDDISVLSSLEEAVRVCSPKAAARGIEIHVDCAKDIRAVANASLLEQAVINLLDNAIKYSEAGSRVDIQSVQSGEEIVLSVRDTGCGISEEDLSRIFERFYRVDRARSRALGGTGLGLSIVKHIATLHGGRVSVESVLGKGSCFAIHLPRLSAPQTIS